MNISLKALSKKVSLAAVTLLAASSLAGAGASLVHADTATTGQLIINAEEAAPSKTATQGDGTDQSALDTTGTQGDGTGHTHVGSTADSSATGTVYGMANVQFIATAITVNSGSTPGDLAPNGQTNTVTNGTLATSPAATLKTDSTGIATTTLANGYYLIHETTTVGGITPIDDFIVQIYGDTTHVYPKLSLTTANANTGTEVNKDTNPITGDSIPVKNGDTNANWAPNNETTTASEGKEVDFVLTPTFDKSMTTTEDNTAGNANPTASYVITETITNGAKGVTIDPNAVAIAGLTEDTEDSSYATTKQADYNVSFSTDDGTGATTVTITLHASGIAKLAAASADGDTLTDGKQLTVTVPAKINTDYVGSVTSSYTTTVTNAYGTNLSNTDASTTKETINVGGGQLTKKDGSTGQVLTGAEFKIVAAASAADAVAVANGTSTSGTVVDTTATDHTTNTDGITTFEGLSIPKGTTGDGTDEADGVTYWAVETKAPTGYQLPSGDAAAFQLTISDNVTSLSNTDVTNNKTLNLPFTGGEGIIGILVIAAVAGSASILVRKRRNEDDKAAE